LGIAGRNKKADADERLIAFVGIGLLVDESPGLGGLLFS
jgi:hypothetical protein